MFAFVEKHLFNNVIKHRLTFIYTEFVPRHLTDVCAVFDFTRCRLDSEYFTPAASQRTRNTKDLFDVSLQFIDVAGSPDSAEVGLGKLLTL